MGWNWHKPYTIPNFGYIYRISDILISYRHELSILVGGSVLSFYHCTTASNCVFLSVFLREYHVFFGVGIGVGWGGDGVVY